MSLVFCKKLIEIYINGFLNKINSDNDCIKRIMSLKIFNNSKNKKCTKKANNKVSSSEDISDNEATRIEEFSSTEYELSCVSEPESEHSEPESDYSDYSDSKQKCSSNNLWLKKIVLKHFTKFIPEILNALPEMIIDKMLSPYQLSSFVNKKEVDINSLSSIIQYVLSINSFKSFNTFYRTIIKNRAFNTFEQKIFFLLLTHIQKYEHYKFIDIVHIDSNEEICLNDLQEFNQFCFDMKTLIRNIPNYFECSVIGTGVHFGEQTECITFLLTSERASHFIRLQFKNFRQSLSLFFNSKENEIKNNLPKIESDYNDSIADSKMIDGLIFPSDFDDINKTANRIYVSIINNDTHYEIVRYACIHDNRHFRSDFYELSFVMNSKQICINDENYGSMIDDNLIIGTLLDNIQRRILTVCPMHLEKRSNVNYDVFSEILERIKRYFYLEKTNFFKINGMPLLLPNIFFGDENTIAKEIMSVYEINKNVATLISSFISYKSDEKCYYCQKTLNHSNHTVIKSNRNFFVMRCNGKWYPTTCLKNYIKNDNCVKYSQLEPL